MPTYFDPLPPFNVMANAWAIYRDRIATWRYRFYDRKTRDFLRTALQIAWDDHRMRQFRHDTYMANYGHLLPLTEEQLLDRLEMLRKELRELEYYSRLPREQYTAIGAEMDVIRNRLQELGHDR